jgi:hypothetical protein
MSPCQKSEVMVKFEVHYEAVTAMFLIGWRPLWDEFE